MSAHEYFSKDQILAMPQDERCRRVTAFNAKEEGLIVIDAVGWLPQWMGTQAEHNTRLVALRNDRPVVKVDWSHNDTGR